MAATAVGGSFRYTRNERLTLWSQTLPQVAITLAAALVAYGTLNPAGQRLIDDKLLNVVLVLMLTTSISGLLLTKRFAPQMIGAANDWRRSGVHGGGTAKEMTRGGDH